MVFEPIVILLIEDNDDHAELIMRSLSRQRVSREWTTSVNVRRCIDGQDALDYLFHRDGYTDSAQFPRPRLVLLDLRLPRQDGFDVLHTIKKTAELKSIPVVVLTSSEDERDVVQAYASQANSYLVKPVGFDVFNQLMETILMYWIGLNELPQDR